MKKTLIGLIVCGMMLVTILPICALGITCSSDSARASTGGFGRTTVRGFALYLGSDLIRKHIHLFAIRLHYTTVTISGEQGRGVIYMKPIDIPTKIIGFHGRVYIYASFLGALDV